MSVWELYTKSFESGHFPSGQCPSPQIHPRHRLFEDGHQDGSPSSLQPGPCSLRLLAIPKAFYSKIEDMKEAVTRVLNTLIQGAFQKLLERYNKCIDVGGEYFEGD